MNKKITAIALALTCIFAFSILAGCKPTSVDNASSAITQGENGDSNQSQTTSEEGKTQSNTSKKPSDTNKNSSTGSRQKSWLSALLLRPAMKKTAICLFLPLGWVMPVFLHRL